MKKNILVILSLIFACTMGASVRTFTVDDDTDFWNPERGFYHYSSARLDGKGNGGSLDQSSFQDCWNDNMSLKFRYYIMEHYNNGGAIAQADLNRITSDCAAARSAGCKLIIRFTYSNSGYQDDDNWHITEPTKAQMQAHMAQLKPILAANADVLAVVQAGFVGIWGEWYFTSRFGKDWSNANAVSDRNDLINSLLDMVPADRFVQLRTVHYITEYMGNGSRNYSTQLTDQTAFSGSAQSRLGHHNDAFGTSEDNWGTYYDKSNEYSYLANLGQYVPLGGESAGGEYNWYKGSQAMSDMQNLHYDYMHVDYHQDVVNSWKTEKPAGSSQSYFDIMKRRLGYRFQLLSATISDSVAPGGTFNVKLQMKNSGFSNLYNKRIAYIVLKGGGKTYKLPLQSDPRLWKCGQTTSINENLTLPSAVSNGTYSIYLNLPDMYASIADKKAYAIQLANQNMGWSTDGLNDLGMTIVVKNGAADSGDGGQGGGGDQDTDHTYATSINFLTLAGQHATTGSQSTDGLQDELSTYHYTIASSTDGEVYWDNQSGADGGLGIDNPNPNTIHTLSFWVRANYKVTITVGTLNGDGASNTASLTMNGGSPVTIQQNTTTEYTTTAATEFVLSTLPAGKSWSWNRIHEITIEPLPGTSTGSISVDNQYLPSAVQYLQDGQLRIVCNGQIYDILGHPIY